MEKAPGFDLPERAAVVTSTYVIKQGMPVLYVSHEVDDEDGSHVWQFHCGNGDYRPEVLQLVGLFEILQIDPGLTAIASLPVGFRAKRTDPLGEWIMAREH